MNVERMLELATFLENLPREKFDMDHWFSRLQVDENGEFFQSIYGGEIQECRTAACVAGWAILHFLGYEAARDTDTHNIVTCAADVLGLDYELSKSELFMNYDIVTTADAARRLRKMVEIYRQWEKENV